MYNQWRISEFSKGGGGGVEKSLSQQMCTHYIHYSNKKGFRLTLYIGGRRCLEGWASLLSARKIFQGFPHLPLVYPLCFVEFNCTTSQGEYIFYYIIYTLDCIHYITIILLLYLYIMNRWYYTCLLDNYHSWTG